MPEYWALSESIRQWAKRINQEWTMSKIYYGKNDDTGEPDRIEVACLTSLDGEGMIELRNTRTGHRTCILKITEKGIRRMRHADCALIATDDTGRVAIVE